MRVKAALSKQTPWWMQAAGAPFQPLAPRVVRCGRSTWEEEEEEAVSGRGGSDGAAFRCPHKGSVFRGAVLCHFVSRESIIYHRWPAVRGLSGDSLPGGCSRVFPTRNVPGLSLTGLHEIPEKFDLYSSIYISRLSWSYFHLLGLGLALGLVEASSTNVELGENGGKDKRI